MDDTRAADTPPAAGGILHDLPIEVTISVGHARPTLRELLALGENAVLLLDRRLDDPVELFIGERLIARGVLQEAGDGEPGLLAVRLTEVTGQRGGPG
ncbi:MAG: FliM/FliN family flagellar motor switch protein [Rubellimicrobium sp.]|nr:FliM/FliN family flagellar motor switch protein [Rubellimicrobium sp.]